VTAQHPVDPGPQRLGHVLARERLGGEARAERESRAQEEQGGRTQTEHERLLEMAGRTDRPPAARM
jgi:hypothetical protein